MFGARRGLRGEVFWKACMCQNEQETSLFMRISYLRYLAVHAAPWASSYCNNC